MKVVKISEENHGFIGIAKNFHSAIDFIIKTNWINDTMDFYEYIQGWHPLSWFVERSSFTNMIDFLYDKIDNDREFFDGCFYFDEVEVYG